MQRGAQRLVGEVLLPVPRGEFGNSGGEIVTDSLQHIDQIVVGVDLV